MKDLGFLWAPALHLDCWMRAPCFLRILVLSSASLLAAITASQAKGVHPKPSNCLHQALGIAKTATKLIPVAILASRVRFNSRSPRSCCVCLTGSGPAHETPFYQVGCKMWLGEMKDRCDAFAVQAFKME